MRVQRLPRQKQSPGTVADPEELRESHSAVGARWKLAALLFGACFWGFLIWVIWFR